MLCLVLENTKGKKVKENDFLILLLYYRKYEKENQI